ncbi:hypothetical protein Aph01nite_33270 [Acrocarpospora phusangensis]|uniref:Uncharacterized protein n=1 Tax=Acrocarpospora phusangensis TaxID=1070424 RepID=A0A919QEY2_9ACTN|nr:hypothetical protein [Acrocarpospora phusangensis]GIH25017.1 hypothetical protein Aph01nite_33270 [Acrocarpospora phusangensis]
MPAVAWVRLGGPGEVTWARAGDAATIAVGTAGRHLFLRRRTAAGWRWERLGVPPGTGEVRDTALISIDGSDGLVPVVVGGDVKVWLHQPGTAATPWTALSGPAPDADMSDFNECGDIAAGAIRRSSGLRHTLVVSSPSGRPWLRQGVEPDDVWFRIAAESDFIVWGLATAFASVAPGSPPLPHIFAIGSDRDTFEFKFQVAVPENSLWTWFDPVDPVPGFVPGVTATTFRDADGRLQACAVPSSEFTADILIGSGRHWELIDLGQPPGPGDSGFVLSAVVAAKGADPAPGEPVVMVRAGDHMWTRTLTGGWRDLGSPSPGVAVDPASAVEIGTADGEARVLTAALSRDADLWTVESGAQDARWESHGLPCSVTSIVGAYHDSPDEDSSSLPVAVPVLDEHGALWSGRVLGRPDAGFSNPGDGFIDPGDFWTFHGRPAPDVTSTAGIGIFALPKGTPPGGTWIFTIGSDGHLWARTSGGNGWAWVDHGAPTGGSVKAGVPPISVRHPPSAFPMVHVLADDGRLWMRSFSGDTWIWTDRGAPPGQLIFSVIGATPVRSTAGLIGRFALAAAITGDGHLWINLHDGTDSTWTDLGTPSPAEKLVAGIGVSTVALPDPGVTVDIVAVGSPSGQVWSHRWSTTGTSRWTPHGRPGDARIHAALGTLQDPADPAATLIPVVGNDRQISLTSSTGTPWSRLDPPPSATTILSGRIHNLLHGLPCILALDNNRRLHVTPLH